MASFFFFKSEKHPKNAIQILLIHYFKQIAVSSKLLLMYKETLWSNYILLTIKQNCVLEPKNITVHHPTTTYF